VVELPCVVDLTELLPHELEHVLEQVEGLDLPALAKDGSSGVQELSRGVYETDARPERGVRGDTGGVRGDRPAFSAAMRGVKRAFKPCFRRGVAATPPRSGRRAPPAAPPGGPGGHPGHKQ
jgi:hypothetical protein